MGCPDIPIAALLCTEESRDRAPAALFVCSWT